MTVLIRFIHQWGLFKTLILSGKLASLRIRPLPIKHYLTQYFSHNMLA